MRLLDFRNAFVDVHNYRDGGIRHALKPCPLPKAHRSSSGEGLGRKCFALPDVLSQARELLLKHHCFAKVVVDVSDALLARHALKLRASNSPEPPVRMRTNDTALNTRMRSHPPLVLNEASRHLALLAHNSVLWIRRSQRMKLPISSNLVQPIHSHFLRLAQLQFVGEHRNQDRCDHNTHQGSYLFVVHRRVLSATREDERVPRYVPLRKLAQHWSLE